MGLFCTTNNCIFPISIYRLSFPFLSERCRPDISNGMIHDIYKLIVDIRYPSMFYVGMNRFVTPCTHYHYQSEFAVALITGDIPYKTQQVRTCILFFAFSFICSVKCIFCGACVLWFWFDEYTGRSHLWWLYRLSKQIHILQYTDISQILVNACQCYNIIIPIQHFNMV